MPTNSKRAKSGLDPFALSDPFAPFIGRGGNDRQISGTLLDANSRCLLRSPQRAELGLSFRPLNYPNKIPTVLRKVAPFFEPPTAAADKAYILANFLTCSPMSPSFTLCHFRLRPFTDKSGQFAAFVLGIGIALSTIYGYRFYRPRRNCFHRWRRRNHRVSETLGAAERP